MPLDLQEASAQRSEVLLDDELDVTLRSLFAHYETVTADPNKMGHLRGLIKFYSGKAHPWQACYKDNFKRFGPKTPAICGVLKDVIRQRTDWRGHDNPKDHGAPGVAIAEADKSAIHRTLKLSIPEIPDEVWAAIDDLTHQCDPCRVLFGLDEAPSPSQTYLSEVSA